MTTGYCCTAVHSTNELQSKQRHHKKKQKKRATSHPGAPTHTRPFLLPLPEFPTTQGQKKYNTRPKKHVALTKQNKTKKHTKITKRKQAARKTAIFMICTAIYNPNAPPNPRRPLPSAKPVRPPKPKPKGLPKPALGRISRGLRIPPLPPIPPPPRRGNRSC